MNYEYHKDAKHPSAEMRAEVVRQAEEKGGTPYRIAFNAMQGMDDLHSRFLLRQYYWRDEALAALDNGDLDRVRRCLREISVSGHGFDDIKD